MKVIKESKWTIQIECSCCHSTLEAEEPDVRYWSATRYGGDVDCGFDVPCPICGTYADLKAGQLPDVIKEKARRRYSESKQKDDPAKSS